MQKKTLAGKAADENSYEEKELRNRYVQWTFIRKNINVLCSSYAFRNPATII